MKKRIYCVGSFTEAKFGDEKNLLYPDYLSKNLSDKDFIVETEKEVAFNRLEFLFNHIYNLKNSSIIIIDATGDCGYNVPWDIGYLDGNVIEVNKDKKLIIIKIRDNCNPKRQWRMNQSIDNLKTYFDIGEITDEIGMIGLITILIDENEKINQSLKKNVENNVENLKSRIVENTKLN